jgi:hypothetical protein
MQANVQEGNFTGSVAADLSDFIVTNYGYDLNGIGELFKINKDKFEVIGVSLYGLKNMSLSLYCIDKQKSTKDKKYIIDMSIDITKYENIISVLFKRINIVLNDKFDSEFLQLESNEEGHYTEYHEMDME